MERPAPRHETGSKDGKMYIQRLRRAIGQQKILGAGARSRTHDWP